jgi:hypothetical protein
MLIARQIACFMLVRLPLARFHLMMALVLAGLRKARLTIILLLIYLIRVI